MTSILSEVLRRIKNAFHTVNAFLAVLFYRYPARQLKVIGATGTDGKTTTVHMIYEVLKKQGMKVSMISTVYAEILGQKHDTGFHVTTPSSWKLQEIVRRIVDRGGEFLVLEVTSHAIDQNRVFGIPFEIAVITNITNEHLDYHKTFHDYLKTKAKILKGAKHCVLNRDDKNYSELRSYCRMKPTTFSLIKKADYSPKNVTIKTKLIGEYNKYNFLASFAVCTLLLCEKKQIYNVLSKFSGVKGRMEEVKSRRRFKIFIDFAHTPNSLKNVLQEARKTTVGKLISVFGCAGERDRLKRPEMGRIASKYADYVILTAEDPRREDVRDIIDQIESGILKNNISKLDKNKKEDLDKLLDQDRKYYFKIPDRQEAINFAVRNLARPSDLIIITGKGHERSMCYQTTEHPWDEKEAVEKALKTR